VDALAGLARVLGWQAVVVDEQGAPEDHPEADIVLSTLDVGAGGSAAGTTFVVVATMGHDDERALEAALAGGAAYVGLVASARRAKSVFDHLRRRGLTEDDLARVHAPAGLDLGPLATREIAVAIVAEILSLREGTGLQPVPAATEEVEEAVDPVCGMPVPVSGAQHRLTHAGEEYFFCGPGCRAAFEAHPDAYTAG
jgi:xanthine dehydrogenase accessory factor